MRAFLIALVILLLAGIAFVWWLFGGTSSEPVGSVTTNFRILGPSDRITVDAFDDPKVEGVACFLSRPERGGIKGALGVAEELPFVSITCSQIAPIVVKAPLPDGERVFDERRSLIFKTLNVVRFYDATRRVLLYVAYTDRIVTGSPESSVSSVPLMDWNGVAPQLPAAGR